MSVKKSWRTKRTYRWKFYQVPHSDLFFFQTYGLDPSIKACPGALKPFLAADEPIASAEYHGSRTGYITTYLIKANPESLKAAAAMKWRAIEIRRIPGSEEESAVESAALDLFETDAPDEAEGAKIHKAPETDEEADSKYRIRSRHVDLEKIMPGLAEAFRRMTRDDVSEFCHYKAAKDPPQDFCAGHTLVDKIKFTPYHTHRPPRKHELVTDGKGTFEEICLLKIGIDFSVGCLANTSPEGIYNPEMICTYCYGFKNRPPFMGTGYLFDRQSLIKRIKQNAEQLGIAPDATLFVRFAQDTEIFVPNSLRRFPEFIDKLDIALDALTELSYERPVRAVLPAKCLEFDERVAKKLISANTVLLASIVNSQLEPGIIGHGFTPEKRLDELLKFAEAGVVSVVYIATDITRGPEHFNNDAELALEFFGKHSDLLDLEFLDMRIRRKEDAEILGAASWDDLKYSPQRALFRPELEGMWHLNSQNHLCARQTHPYFLDVIGSNRGKIRLCSTHVEDKSERRCGMCFMDRIRAKG